MSLIRNNCTILERQVTANGRKVSKAGFSAVFAAYARAAPIRKIARSRLCDVVTTFTLGRLPTTADEGTPTAIEAPPRMETLMTREPQGQAESARSASSPVAAAIAVHDDVALVVRLSLPDPRQG
jgi:hypothetical protein